MVSYFALCPAFAKSFWVDSMPQKWYQKATVQAAIAGGVFVVIAAIITGLFSVSIRNDASPNRGSDSPPITPGQPTSGTDSLELDRPDLEPNLASPSVNDRSKPIDYDTVDVVIPSRYRGASIEIDGSPAQVLARTRTTAKLLVAIKQTNQMLEIKKDGQPGCKQALPFNFDKLITPCQN